MSLITSKSQRRASATASEVTFEFTCAAVHSFLAVGVGAIPPYDPAMDEDWENHLLGAAQETRAKRQVQHDGTHRFGLWLVPVVASERMDGLDGRPDFKQVVDFGV